MKFFKELKNEIIINKFDLLLYLSLIFGCFIIGEIISVCILTFVHDDNPTYFSMGIFMSTLSAVGVCLFGAASSLAVSFNIRIEMGKKRLSSFVILSITQIIFIGIAEFSVNLIGSFLDNILYKTFYFYLPLETDMPSLTLPWWAALIAFPVILVPFSSLFSLLMQRFGKSVFWVIWVIWMLGCFAPQMLEKAPEGSALRVIANGTVNFFKGLPVYGYIIIAAAAFIACIIGDIVLVKKYNVKA